MVPFFSVDRLGKLVNKVNNLEPDIILLGGDYVHIDSKYIEPCFQELSNLKATFGVFGVLANHDHREGPELTRKYMTEAGIHLIDNKAYWIEKEGERIKIGGLVIIISINSILNLQYLIPQKRILLSL